MLNVKAPLPIVETAFMASTTTMLFLINYYFPIGPLFRMFFPTPIALVFLRWGYRAAWKCVLVTVLLLTLLMGPTRSIQFFIPHAFVGIFLGYAWKRGLPWSVTLPIGCVLNTLGVFFQAALVSVLVQENIWLYFVVQFTQLLTNIFQFFGVYSPPSLWLVQLFAVLSIFAGNFFYQCLIHIGAWLLLDRLGNTIPPPPQWLQNVLDE